MSTISFDFDIPSVLQYAFNIFGSMSPLLYVFIGAGFALFVLGKLIKLAKD